MGLILIHPNDTVLVQTENGHKYARQLIHKGDLVIKYGFPIGEATAEIQPGELVHTHNLISRLSGTKEYHYKPDFSSPKVPEKVPAFSAYKRADGRIGIRNEVWILPTVACVNNTATCLAQRTGAFAFTHPYGCSQLGDDLHRTAETLCALARHPNAGGVLILGLGCENNRLSDLKQRLNDLPADRIRFLNCQDCEDEMATGETIIRELQQITQQDKREPVPLSELTIGLKCGGSDGFSGITANPLCGKMTDRLTSLGGTAVLSEVPEMFGAEDILLHRCVSKTVFQQAAAMINRWKTYFLSHGQPVSENPSPGNRDGGITTLEEKSLGCVQKGGSAPVSAVLNIGEPVQTPGLNLLDGPGNDPIAATGLTAAGCHLLLFTTGRGTPLGAPVPTIKIATNTALAQRKNGWIDFDAQTGSADDLWDLILRTAEGAPTKNETNGNRQIAIFKDGVTL